MKSQTSFVLGHTLWIVGLSKQCTRLLPVDDWSINCRDIGDPMTEVPFELVHVVCAFPSSASMLAIDRIDPQTSRADAQDARIL